MSAKIYTGTSLLLSNYILKSMAFYVGVAKTGTPIYQLSGAALNSATAAWIGFGSMNVGIFMMGTLPVIGALLILDGICGEDRSSSPLIDWYEECWNQYEIECELEELKKTIEIDREHQLRAKRQATSLAQLDTQFQALEIEHELYAMKKSMGMI